MNLAPNIHDFVLEFLVSISEQSSRTSTCPLPLSLTSEVVECPDVYQTPTLMSASRRLASSHSLPAWESRGDNLPLCGFRNYSLGGPPVDSTTSPCFWRVAHWAFVASNKKTLFRSGRSTHHCPTASKVYAKAALIAVKTQVHLILAISCPLRWLLFIFLLFLREQKETNFILMGKGL